MNHRYGKQLWVLIALLILPCAAMAQPGEVHINADHLTSDSQGRYALFSGHVRITRDGAIITADTVQLHYEDGKKQSDTVKGLSLIEAKGNVIMTFDENRATAQKAIYDLSKEEITLSEGPPRVTRGENTLTGTTIVIQRLTGAIRVDGDSSQRVEVKLVPGEKGFSFTPDEKNQ